jgi:nitrous oxidase accessory protein
MLRLAAILALFVSAAPAAERIVPAEPGALMRAVAEAEAGDVLRLAPGRHRGPVLLDRPLTLDGGGRAAVDGLGTGSVITVTAPDVAVRGLEITGSGSSSDPLDAGVSLLKGADGARVEDNRILGNLVGVDIHGAKDALVARNVIEGRRDHRMNERGNGVYVWNSPGAVVEGNDIRQRDFGQYLAWQSPRLCGDVFEGRDDRRQRVDRRPGAWDHAELHQ